MAGLSFPLIFFSNFQRPSERDEAANGRIFPVWSHLAVIELTFFAHELWPQKTKDNIWTRTLACHFIQCQARNKQTSNSAIFNSIYSSSSLLEIQYFYCSDDGGNSVSCAGFSISQAFSFSFSSFTCFK